MTYGEFDDQLTDHDKLMCELVKHLLSLPDKPQKDPKPEETKK